MSPSLYGKAPPNSSFLCISVSHSVCVCHVCVGKKKRDREGVDVCVCACVCLHAQLSFQRAVITRAVLRICSAK